MVTRVRIAMGATLAVLLLAGNALACPAGPGCKGGKPGCPKPAQVATKAAAPAKCPMPSCCAECPMDPALCPTAKQGRPCPKAGARPATLRAKKVVRR